MAALDFYWVEHRDDPDGPWTRPEPLPVGWRDAVDQLRRAAQAALAGVDDDPDDVATECRVLLRAIGKGLLDEVPSPASIYTGRYLRIVRAGPVLADPIAAGLRWWVIHDAHGLAAVTITTFARQAITGTLGGRTSRRTPCPSASVAARPCCDPSGSSPSPSSPLATRSRRREQGPPAGRPFGAGQLVPDEMPANMRRAVRSFGTCLRFVSHGGCRWVATGAGERYEIERRRAEPGCPAGRWYFGPDARDGTWAGLVPQPGRSYGRRRRLPDAVGARRPAGHYRLLGTAQPRR